MTMSPFSNNRTFTPRNISLMEGPPITSAEVERAVHNSKNGKAMGTD